MQKQFLDKELEARSLIYTLLHKLTLVAHSAPLAQHTLATTPSTVVLIDGKRTPTGETLCQQENHNSMPLARKPLPGSD